MQPIVSPDGGDSIEEIHLGSKLPQGHPTCLGHNVRSQLRSSSDQLPVSEFISRQRTVIEQRRVEV